MFPLPFGQLKRHTLFRRMHQKDRPDACGVKPLARDEWRLNGRLCSSSARLWQALCMTRQIAQGGAGTRALRRAGPVLAVGVFVLLASGASAKVLPADNPSKIRLESGYVFAQQRLDLRPPIARRNRPISDVGRRMQRRPDAFHGLMIPGVEAGRECLGPQQIRRRLKRHGWWDFHGLRRAGDDFLVRARRPDGTLYQLRIEGCGGQVLKAAPLDRDGGRRLWAR